jgi:hypothetical protein
MQDKALSLMAQKMETSLAVEGELSDQGLAALSESENSMVYELAKALTGKTTVANVNQAWDKYRQRELASVLALDDDQGVTAEEETTITTTTTLTTADGRTSQIRHELIIRGRVYIRRDSAVAYVAGNKFKLRSGDVFWNDRKIGNYDRHGRGEINNKPIRIYRPPNLNHFVLAEVRDAA